MKIARRVSRTVYGRRTTRCARSFTKQESVKDDVDLMHTGTDCSGNSNVSEASETDLPKRKRRRKCSSGKDGDEAPPVLSRCPSVADDDDANDVSSQQTSSANATLNRTGSTGIVDDDFDPPLLIKSDLTHPMSLKEPELVGADSTSSTVARGGSSPADSGIDWEMFIPEIRVETISTTASADVKIADDSRVAASRKRCRSRTSSDDWSRDNRIFNNNDDIKEGGRSADLKRQMRSPDSDTRDSTESSGFRGGAMSAGDSCSSANKPILSPPAMLESGEDSSYGSSYSAPSDTEATGGICSKCNSPQEKDQSVPTRSPDCPGESIP